VKHNTHSIYYSRWKERHLQRKERQVRRKLREVSSVFHLFFSTRFYILKSLSQLHLTHHRYPKVFFFPLLQDANTTRWRYGILPIWQKMLASIVAHPPLFGLDIPAEVRK